MQAAVAHGRERYSGKLTIALGRDLPAFFAPWIAAFSHKHPHLQITMLSRSSTETLSLLLNDDVDVGIGAFTKVPRGVEKKRVLDRKIRLIFPTTHALSRKKSISLTDIAASRLILHTSGSATRRLIDAAVAAKGIEIDNILEAGTCQSIIDFVRLGLGVGFVHDICLPNQREKKIRSLDVTGQFGTTELSFIHRKSTTSKPSHQRDRARCGCLAPTSEDSCLPYFLSSLRCEVQRADLVTN
jgi:DNA-binding transcriptional LysR family regulator